MRTKKRVKTRKQFKKRSKTIKYKSKGGFTEHNEDRHSEHNDEHKYSSNNANNITKKQQLLKELQKK